MSAAAPWVEALAPAKVNPWLKVGARRTDGYREVDLGMLALELADRVRVRQSERPGELSFRVGGAAASADVPRGASNLAARAARGVLELGARDTGLELELVKSIPSQAGLGGGSSDAAAAALAAWAALGEPCPRARLVEITGALGSDVAFFLEASETGYARCTGRGERVESLPSTGAARWTVALVVPAVASPTGEVYARFADEGRGAPPLSPRAPAPSVVATFFDGEESEVRAALANDLERAAEAAQPELARWRTLLDAVGAGHWRMCGSGSAFFGLYAGADEARADLARVEERAGAAGLTLRGSWATRPAGRGARLCAS